MSIPDLSVERGNQTAMDITNATLTQVYALEYDSTVTAIPAVLAGYVTTMILDKEAWSTFMEVIHALDVGDPRVHRQLHS